MRKSLHTLGQAILPRTRQTPAPAAVAEPPSPSATVTARASFKEISREDMLALPVRRYEGPIVLVATPADLARAAADLRQASVLGFDTETRPAFRKGESYPPCLVQLATAQAVYLFQLRETFVFPLIAELMAATRCVKAGVSVADDLRGLKTVFPFAEQNVVDLGRVARHCGMKQTGVRNLAGMLLGFRITKGSKTSNWAAHTLSPSQIHYAATDAWACRELYLDFQRRGFIPAAG